MEASSSQTEPVHPEILENKTPETLLYFANTGVSLLHRYGWFLLGFGAFSLFAWHRWLRPRYLQWAAARDQALYDATYHKDPDMYLARQQAMQEARQRMQQENDLRAVQFAERQQEREAERQRQKAEERARLYGDEQGNRLGGPSSGQEGPARNLREYNPLMGAGGSGGYRPQRRGCPGGGCNR